MHRVMEEIILWHCSGVMEAHVALIAAFRSSVLLGLGSLWGLSEGSMKCSKISWKLTVDFRKTVDQHQQMTWQPKLSLTVETSHWTLSNIDSMPLHSSSRFWDLDFQMKCKIYFHLKRGLWTTEQQTSYFSPLPR